MRRVLLVSYHYPPIGGAAVQRAVKLARYLPEFGWEPRVLTGPGSVPGRWTPEDDSLARDVAEVEVLRVPGEPGAVSPAKRRAARLLGLPDPAVRWWMSALERAGREAAAGVDAILAVLEPYETGPAVVRIARRLDLPLVVDLLDPWALDEMRFYPSAAQRLLDLRRMHGVVAGATRTIPNTAEAARRFRCSFPDAAPRVADPIPNGFDAADFAVGEAEARDDGRFRIVHTGYLHTELGVRHRRSRRLRRVLRGGYRPDVDVLTRSHVYLLRALDRLRGRRPELAQSIEVQLAGVLSPLDRAFAARDGAVRLRGYLPHAETVALMRSADLLFLPMQNLPPGVRAGIVPGKTYEDIAAGPPVLAAVPEGDARDLLAEAGHARIVRPDDVRGMADALALECERRLQGRVPAVARAEVVDRYERRRQTGAVAELLEEALRAGP